MEFYVLADREVVTVGIDAVVGASRAEDRDVFKHGRTAEIGLVVIAPFRRQRDMGACHTVRTLDGNGCGIGHFVAVDRIGNEVMCHSVLTDRRGKSVLGVDHIDRAGAQTRAFNRGDRTLERTHGVFSCQTVAASAVHYIVFGRTFPTGNRREGKRNHTDDHAERKQDG